MCAGGGVHQKQVDEFGTELDAMVATHNRRVEHVGRGERSGKLASHPYLHGHGHASVRPSR